MPNCLKELLAHPEQSEAFINEFLGMNQADVGKIDTLFPQLKANMSEGQLTPQLIRLTMTHSALRSLFGELESDLLEPFYRHGLIALETAIMAAQSQSLDFDMCDALVALAPHFNTSQLESAIASVEAVKDDYRRQMALAQLYPYLEEPTRTERAVALYPQLVSKQHSSELHVKCWPLLPIDVRHEAILTALDEAITKSMPGYATAEYLMGILPWLTELSGESLCRWLLKWVMVKQPNTSGDELDRLQTLELGEAIEEVAVWVTNLALQSFDRLYNSAARSFLAASSIPYLPNHFRTNAIALWLKTLYETEKLENQAAGLAGLAPYLEEDVRQQALSDAWLAAEKVDSKDTKALLMTMITQQMPQAQQPKQMRAALRALDNYRHMNASKAILNALSAFPQWGVQLILEQEYRYSKHIDDDLYIRGARVAFNPNGLLTLIDDKVLKKLIEWWIPACQLSEMPILVHVLDTLSEPKRSETIQSILDRSTDQLAPRALAFSLRILLPYLDGQQHKDVLAQFSKMAWKIGEQKEYMHKIAVLYGKPMELSYLVGLGKKSARLKTATAAFSAMIALAKDTLGRGISAAHGTDQICTYLENMLPYLDASAADLLLETAKVGLPNYIYWPVAAMLFPLVSASKQDEIQALFDSDELALSRRDELPMVQGSIKARGKSLSWWAKAQTESEIQSLLKDMERLPAKLQFPMFCDWVKQTEEPLRSQFFKSSVDTLSQLNNQSDLTNAIINISMLLPDLSLSEDQWLCSQVLIRAADGRRKEYLETLHTLKPRLAHCGMIEAVSEALDMVHTQFPSLDDTFKFEAFEPS